MVVVSKSCFVSTIGRKEGGSDSVVWPLHITLILIFGIDFKHSTIKQEHYHSQVYFDLIRQFGFSILMCCRHSHTSVPGFAICLTWASYLPWSSMGTQVVVSVCMCDVIRYAVRELTVVVCWNGSGV